jgi:fructuronate reductase
VIENRFSGPRPEWEAAGAILSGDVRPYENTKLRLLNATHSALAYLGLLMGVETVFDAMQNPGLAGQVERMIESEITPAVAPLPGLRVADYAAAVLRRYRNPAIRHYLSQIAWDGSQKIPIRILGTLRENLAAGRPIRRLCLVVAGWMHFVRTQAARGLQLNDPLAERLLRTGADCTLVAVNDVARFLEIEAVFARDLARDREFVDALGAAYQSLRDGSPAAVESALRL